MKARVDFITLRVEDLEAATGFYTEGLGWKPILAVPDEVTFLQLGPGKVLALFIASGFDEDVGPEIQARIQCNLAHNVQSEAEVRDAVAAMVEAGATVVKEPQRDGLGRLPRHRHRRRRLLLGDRPQLRLVGRRGRHGVDRARRVALQDRGLTRNVAGQTPILRTCPSILRTRKACG